MFFYVRYERGEPKQICTIKNISPEDDILDIRRYLEEKFGLEVDRQFLVMQKFGSKSLEQTKKIKDYPLQDGQYLYLYDLDLDVEFIEITSDNESMEESEAIEDSDSKEVEHHRNLGRIKNRLNQRYRRHSC